MMPLFNRIFPASIIAFVSDRTIDFSLSKDQRALNKQQKEYLLAQLGFDLSEPVSIQQVHGDKIVITDKAPSRGGHDLGEVDGLVTKVPCLPLIIRTADCLPIFMYDARQECIGLIHAGWKGSQRNIAGQAVQLMKKQWQSDPRDVKVAFGPALRSCCYEVGEEFKEYFQQGLAIRDGRHYFDLPQVNKKQLIDSGMQKENIFDCEICTCCDKNYFSYRREGESAGRMISLMMLK